MTFTARFATLLITTSAFGATYDAAIEEPAGPKLGAQRGAAWQITTRLPYTGLAVAATF